MKNLLLLILSLGLSFTAFSQAKYLEVKIKTSAICDQCKTRIENNIGVMKGVRNAQLNLAENTITVRYKPLKTSPEKIKKAITMLGYNADEMVRDASAFEKLPACCKVKMHD